MNSILEKLRHKQALDASEFESAFVGLIEARMPEEQGLEFLSLLTQKGASSTELSIAVQLLRQKMKCVDLGDLDVLDNCGTGGDNLGTFNISTAASFVIAGAGVAVAKHGNKAISSKSGSADVLSALGVKIDVAPQVMEKAVRQIGIGFFMAPLYHASLKNVASIRQKLKSKSIFNILGPLLNPARAKKQVIGVYDKNLQLIMAQALKQSGSTSVTLVTGSDGLDELTLTGKSFVTRLNQGEIIEDVFDPKSVGYDYCSLADLQCGDASENARRLKRVLKGHSLALDHCVHLNAALGLLTFGAASDFLSALLMAQESISSGKAYQKLEALIELTNTGA